MSILHSYKEPKDMLYKLLRDGKKSHFAKSPEELCDNLFNFCVTGHSIRDWCIKYLNLDDTAKRQFHEKCNKDKHLKYCRDIANASKHFSLSTDRSTTVSAVNSEIVNYVSIDAKGNKISGSENKQNSAKILLADGDEMHLLLFLCGVFNGFKAVFDSYSVPYEQEKANVAILAVTYI
jgi:hypothetical protein